MDSQRQHKPISRIKCLFPFQFGEQWSTYTPGDCRIRKCIACTSTTCFTEVIDTQSGCGADEQCVVCGGSDQCVLGMETRLKLSINHIIH